MTPAAGGDGAGWLELLSLAGEPLACRGRSLHGLVPFPECLGQLFTELPGHGWERRRREMARVHKGFYC